MGHRVHDCHVEDVVELLVGKWKLVLLHNLMNKGTMRFSELKKAVPSITQKMLTQQLRELEHEELIERKVYPQVPPKVEYSITDYGLSLKPVLDKMNEWGTEHSLRKKKKLDSNAV